MGAPKQLTEKLHESGKVNGSGGKTEEQVSPLNEKSLVLHILRAEPIEDMQWEKRNTSGPRAKFRVCVSVESKFKRQG